MNAADVFDYLLGRLDGPSRERLENQIASDHCLAERVARVSRNLVRLLDDGRSQHAVRYSILCSPVRARRSPSNPVRSTSEEDDIRPTTMHTPSGEAPI